MEPKNDVLNAIYIIFIAVVLILALINAMMLIITDRIIILEKFEPYLVCYVK